MIDHFLYGFNIVITSFSYRSLSEAMTKEKIAAIKAKRLAKKKTTIRVDDELEPDLLVRILSQS